MPALLEQGSQVRRLRSSAAVAATRDRQKRPRAAGSASQHGFSLTEICVQWSVRKEPAFQGYPLLIQVLDQPAPIYSEQQLDRYLDQVEAAVPARGSSTVAHGPFAVFVHDPGDVYLPSREHVSPENCVDLLGNVSELDVDLSNWPLLDPNDQTSFEALNAELSHASTQPSQWRPATSWSSHSNYEVALAGSPALTDAAWSSSSCASPGEDFSNHLALYSQMKLGAAPFRMQTDVKQLLHHYVNHVVDLMTVVPTPKGPWKSVHVPRALQGSAALAIVGKTSHSCNALFHALLTISAYNLAANHDIANQELQAQSWREVAIRLKARSLAYLKACLQADCPADERGKYKEILAVMLSMVTIDVRAARTVRAADNYDMRELIKMHLGVLRRDPLFGMALERSSGVYQRISTSTQKALLQESSGTPSSVRVSPNHEREHRSTM